MKTLEWMTNVVVLCVALLFGALVVRAHLSIGDSETAAAEAPPSPLVGRALAVPDVDWQASPVTVVLGLSTTCGYCTQSMPFYTKLAALAAREPRLRIIALFPQPVPDSERYLKTFSVDVARVISTPLPGLGIQGTPTLLIVGRDGTVQKSWAGMLPEGRQQTVLDAVTAELAKTTTVSRREAREGASRPSPASADSLMP
jgi:hypothetical protein